MSSLAHSPNSPADNFNDHSHTKIQFIAYHLINSLNFISVKLTKKYYQLYYTNSNDTQFVGTVKKFNVNMLVQQPTRP